MTAYTETIETSNEEETIAFAKDFAKNLKRGDVVLLYGDLGMGKSVFSRALIRSLCGDQGMEVPSPTFTLVQSYDSDLGEVLHFDLYRLCDPSEIYEIGWEEAMSGDGVTLVEWPERLGGMEPDGAISMHFSMVKGHPNRRVIESQGYDRNA